MRKDAVKLLEDGTPKKEIKSLLGIGSDEPERTRFQEFIDFFRDVIIILIVVLFIRTYLVSPFQISGSSMAENYHDRAFLIVNKFSYVDTAITKIDENRDSAV